MKITIKILDNNDNIIINKNLDSDPAVKYSKPVLNDLKLDSNIHFLDKFKEKIIILTQYQEDYIIEYSNIKTSDLNKKKDIDLFNKSYFKTFPLMCEVGFKDILNKVYESGKTCELKIIFSADNIVMYESEQKIFKFNNKIAIIYDVESKFKLINENEIELLYNAPDPLMIIQDKVIVDANNAIKKITGYTREELIGNNYYFNNPRFKDKPYPEDVHQIYSKMIKKEQFNYTDILTLRHKNGETVYAKATMQPSSFNNEPAVLFYAFDITEGVNHQIRAEKLNNALSKVSGMSKIAYVYWDSKNGYEWSEELFNIIEEKKENLNLNEDIMYNFVLEKYRDEVYATMGEKIRKQGNFFLSTQIKTHSGIKDIDFFVDCKLNENDNVIQCLGYIQDVSEKVKETKKLKDLLNEKEILLEEVHHRVKNNLQIIISLLNLNMRYKPDKPQETLESTLHRLNSMALVHKQIYQSQDHAHINLKEFIEEEVKDISNKYNKPNIGLNLDLKDMNLSMDEAIPLSLIISEILNNSYAYAFPENIEGKVTISLKKLDNCIELIIGDDGVGLPQCVEFENPDCIGFVLIRSLIKQIEGRIDLLQVPGTVFKINFQ